ncbi:hypothetical protein DM02DRAFT_593687 [Periconia macrospinosa]|uniref:Thioredoxin-like protein n=1 Tax=Periconia macrospinosa TaxID=97972 RepID=A0A2V1DP46_9PLEO|nr:hypothetical protein DM02DRAFT_593687 [Periconia macrospinosa]
MSAPPSAEQSAARTPLSPSELAEALQIEVYDAEGKTHALGDLIKGQRSALIFTRHYGCPSCHAYVRAISRSIPPSKLPPNTQVLIIGNGSYQPIKKYADNTSCAYPIYCDPTCKLHAILKFKWTMKEGSADDQKDYMADAGTPFSRVLDGLKCGLGQIHHVIYFGPKGLNGGEVIISADGACEYVYRMQNATDHTNVSELVSLLGVKTEET